MKASNAFLRTITIKQTSAFEFSAQRERESTAQQNRVHRRVIVRDYRKNIHKASSRVAMLAVLEGYIIER